MHLNAPKYSVKSETEQCILVNFECIAVHCNELVVGLVLRQCGKKVHDLLRTIENNYLENQICPQQSKKACLK